MIIFKKIKYKNFLSTGNQFSKVDFLSNKTNLIVGTNGSGKSTLLDALCFSLFGKPYRKINKPQLVNSINEKDCLVEVEFSIGDLNWKIIRGIKPSIFEIYKDNQLLDQNSTTADQQKWLEQNVLKMNYKSFTQIVILGSSNFIPFMQLPTAHRREVIEDLLDIKIFSSMNIVIKEKTKSLKDEIKTLELKKESLIDKVKMQKDFIIQLENLSKESIDKKNTVISSLIKEQESYIFENSKIEDYSKSTEKLKKFNTIVGKITQKLDQTIKEHKFFSENSVCPTCTQSIDESFRLTKIDKIKSKEIELKDAYIDLKKVISEEEERENEFLTISREITKLTNLISKNNVKISGCQTQIKSIESEIQTITEQLNNKNIEHKKLEEYSDNLQKTYENLSSKKEEISYYDFCYSLLKDGGVKTKIIKKYLPLINQQVNRYLQMMDFYINFVLDEEFNEMIKSPIHEDFTYSSFSEGEKARINLALIFAWREVAKFKNSVHTNLILFDEVFDSSLDEYGSDDFLKIIKYILNDTNVFVISHKNGLEDKFDNVISIEKVKGFSKMSN
jgi:DNA repair exonuclease SbcCD ATPase subunit